MKAPKFDPSWPPDVQAVYHHDMQELWDPNLCRNVWNLYHAQIEMYLRLAGREPLRILDVGCAQGTLALKLAEAGHRVTAADIRPQFLEYARSRYTHGEVEFVEANVLEDTLHGEYDLVFANQILEHLVYPAALCRRLAELLAPGGRLVATTPNGDYVRNKLPSFAQLGDPRDWEHMQFSADGDGHFFAYLPAELRGIFVEAGLQQVSVRPFETPVISGHMKFRYLHRVLPYSVLRSTDSMVAARLPFARFLCHQLICQGRRTADA